MALGQRRFQRTSFVIPKLQITSMMDMFTIILIFLLFSFSDNPEKLHIENGMILPKSTSQIDCNKDITVSLSSNSLKVDNQHIADINQGVISNFDHQHPEKSELYKHLMTIRHNRDSKKDQDNSAIVIFCDQHLPYKTIHQVVKTSGMAGFPNFQFAVLKK